VAPIEDCGGDVLLKKIDGNQEVDAIDMFGGMFA
jgi:hypothetical protein